jgi:type I restriction enzyme S subunit
VKEQHRIVAEMDRLLSQSESVGTVVQATHRHLRRLRSAMLNAGFSGALVDQDPTDEPASVLLDRVRAARAKAPSSLEAPRRRGGSRKAAKK